MRKKVLLIVLTMVLSLVFVSCNKSDSNTDKSSNNTEASEENKQEENKQEENNEDGDKEVAEQDKATKKEKCRLYFFDTEKLEMFYVDNEIEIVNNGKVNALTKALQEYKGNDKFLSLTDKAKITSAKVDGDVLKVYFSDDFTKNMALGTATESGLIQSLVNTYGYNYNVKKVAIYMNNELYTGLRGELPEGYYNVDTNAKEYTK